MKRRAFGVALGLALGMIALLGARGASAQDDLAIWREFVSAVKGGRMTEDMVRPYADLPKDVLLKQLAEIRTAHNEFKSWGEWDKPEVYPVGDEVHYVVTFTWGGKTKSDFCFTLLKEGGRWYYRHVENIFIRLDKVDKLPATEFPDLPEETKAWQREENYWSQMVYFQGVFAKDRGKDYLAGLLRDGAGYYLAAKTWVPFVPPGRAFILYACWEQSRLRGNAVSLDSLSDHEAVVRLKPQFFALYKQAGHLRGQIAFEDYRRIFETIWQDRAAAAGWTLEIRYEDPECLTCLLRFAKKP
ncbi:MAG TPA: hypothetical protein VMS75_10950 [Terriglobales bacterium]|nr:hypothetical protein [Terriglobales bacterium]